MGFSIDKECVVKRSKAIKDDFVNWCPKKYPKLYSCRHVLRKGSKSKVLVVSLKVVGFMTSRISTSPIRLILCVVNKKKTEIKLSLFFS